jgi:ribosomal protein S18 acetylase RimI-like enzyme
MTLQVRPAQLKDLGAIEALYRQQVREAERSPLKRQFASSRLWFLLNSTFASIIPITSAADHVYVMEDARRRAIQGFVQAETAALGPGVWQILNLCLSPDLDRVQDGTALLDHLFNEGLNRGVTKFIVRVPVDDPVAELFRARGFSAYATEHALLSEAVPARPVPAVAGWRPMRRDDELGLYLLYVATTPRSVAAVEASNFAEWRRSFQPGSWSARIPRRAGQPRFVIERMQVVGWMSLVPGGGGRPHSLGLMAASQPADLWPALVQRSLGYVAQHQPGPVWCSLRHYDEVGIQLLQREGFEVIASQVLMVRELPLKIRAGMRVRIKDKRLVPQYG